MADTAGNLRIYALSAILGRGHGLTTDIQVCTGAWLAINEDEARGGFIAKAMESNPGFALTHVGCYAVPDDLVSAAFEEIQARMAQQEGGDA